VIIDLSHPIIDAPPCSFALADKQPRLTFEEGDSHGTYFVTSSIDHLPSNLCTHIDFPGHLAHSTREEMQRTVGAYDLGRFVGDVVVLDFRHKLSSIATYFDEDGMLTIPSSDGDTMLSFLQALDTLCITDSELIDAVKAASATLSELTGVLFVSGASAVWQYHVFDSWAYRYFYNPFLSEAACAVLTAADISFVGIDAFQLEHPLINFRGDELPIVLHPSCREYVANRLQGTTFINHTALLGNDVLMYENLRIPPELCGRVLGFSGAPLNLQFPDLTDNALVRPYVQDTARGVS
jgi:kynurenine formamidase